MDISLKSYVRNIKLVNQVLENEMELLTSHATNNVIEKYYLEPKKLFAIDIGALKIRVFGENLARKSSRKKKKDLS